MFCRRDVGLAVSSLIREGKCTELLRRGLGGKCRKLRISLVQLADPNFDILRSPVFYIFKAELDEDDSRRLSPIYLPPGVAPERLPII